MISRSFIQYRKDDLALAAFTLIMQMTIGALVFVCTLLLFRIPIRWETAALTWLGLITSSLAASAAAGLALSLLHLGSPGRAWMALRNFRYSWLSKEIWFALLFTGGLILAAVFYLSGGADFRLVMVGISLTGLILLFVMVGVYRLPGVLRWSGTVTLLNFINTAFLLGGVWFAAVAVTAWAMLGPMLLIEAQLIADLVYMALRSVGMVGILMVGVEFIVVPALEKAEEREAGRAPIKNNAPDEPAARAQLLRLRFILAAAGVLLINGYLSTQPVLAEARGLTLLVVWTAFGLVLASETVGRIHFYAVPMQREL